MLSQEDNELLTRVGPGTPMGSLLRQYWLPGDARRRGPGTRAATRSASGCWART